MTYRFQPFRLMPPIALLAALCAISYWLNPEPWHHLSVATQAIFAAVLVVFAILMIVLRNQLFLRIDERGIEVKYAFGMTRLYAWADIESALIVRKRVLLVPVMSSIGLNLRQGARPANAVLRAAGAITGYSASFPAFFDLSPTEIIERINFYKSQTFI